MMPRRETPKLNFMKVYLNKSVFWQYNLD